MEATYEIKDGVLFVVVRGPYGAAEAFELRGEAARIVEESRVRMGLVDLRAAQILHTTVDIYETNTSLDDFIPKQTRFAFVYSPEALSVELAQFSEDVLVNAGYNARVCTDFDEALAWVKSGGTK